MTTPAANLTALAVAERRLTVTAVETIQVAEFGNQVWVRIHTNEGITGLGETFFGSEAVTAYIHETVAPYLLGENALSIQKHVDQFKGYLGYGAAGVETRGSSAVNIALWDLLGKVTGQPLYQLLGGASRDDIRIYNTCAGPRYIKSRPSQTVDNWGLPATEHEQYEDLHGFLNRPAELATELLEQGVDAMKIWPFDPYAEASRGQYISNGDLRTALEPFEKIRAAVGDRMDIMVEMHGLWNLPTARRICSALEQYSPVWYEDPIRSSDVDALRRLSDGLRTPVALSETMASRESFRRIMDAGAVDVVLIDVSWAGGIGETKHIAGMAESRLLPVALHDCTGPVVLATSINLSMHLPNASIQETVRAYYRGWYGEVVTGLPRIDSGRAFLPTTPGHGVELASDVMQRSDATIRISKVES